MLKNPPLPKVSKIAAPKLPQGRPPSGSTQFRASASSYGKLAQLAGGRTGVKVPKVKE